MQYIPQGPPFEMVDKIISIDAQATITSFTIQADNIFVDEAGYLKEAALVENMAQTAAASTGYLAANTGTTPPIGFIGAIKDLNIIQLPKVGDIITTTMQMITQIGNVHVVQTSIALNQTNIATAEFKIFLQENS
jgi:3-hydroxyacyl-[acyl-carrier-protein] dehydratase